MTFVVNPSELFDAACLQDPYPLYQRMRAVGPVHQIGDSQFYAVCGWDAVNDVLGRPEDFSSNLTATMVYTGAGSVVPFEMDALGGITHVLATADDPAHAVHRKLLVPQLAAKRIRALAPFIAETAERLWSEGLGDGHIEWISAMANQLPMMVLARLIGVPAEDVDQLAQWGYAATQPLVGMIDHEELAAAGVSILALGSYITERLRRAALDPQDNLLGELATACASGELDPLTAQLIMITLVGAGGESTASLLGTGAWILARRQDIQRQVRDDPELLDAFIEETLRVEPPFRTHYRHVRVDTTLGGTRLPADSHLLLLWGAANRDLAHFAAPDEFRLDRLEPKSHLAFGKGAHFCVGAALARLEAQIVLRLLLDRTVVIKAADVGRWLPSLMVRRLEHLELAVKSTASLEHERASPAFTGSAGREAS